MPRPHHHPFAIFSLKPYNDRARAAVAHSINDYGQFTSVLDDGTLGFDIGHIRSKLGNHTLATLGRGDADIFVEGSSIAKIQCSFEINVNTNVVMLYDRSHGQTTQVYGENATPFEHGRLRKVVVQKGLNTIIGMGGKGRNLVMFELEWYENPNVTMEKIKNRAAVHLSYEQNPRLAQTIDETDTIVPTQRETRIHSPGSRQLKIRYARIGDMLGSGQFGKVYKAVDVDEGKFVAVKTLESPEKATKKQQEKWKQSVYYALKREVEILATIDHPHIVDYIASQGWGEPKVEIFMGLKEGSLESLIESGSQPNVAELVFHQVLQALDYLALKGIVHRDVKPENILYVTRPDLQYQFQLGDFGLCNSAVHAATGVGTPLYMAPEMYQRGEQTHKVDVWSLFVTMLWTLDVGGFRQRSKHFKSPGEILEWVLSAALNEDPMSKIRDMAISNPDKRASAAQMLVKCFNGVGLSTPRDQVPAFDTDSTIAAMEDAVPVSQAVTRTGPKSQRRLQKNANTQAVAMQYRVEKTRHPLQNQPLRQAIHRATEKYSEQAVGPVIAEKPRNPSTISKR